MPLLTLCLIARDEEKMLPGCLASARSAVDEIVLVDTGSRDRTIEIARRAGARVLEQPWADDFSAPRNLALEHATGRFVLQLDADERLAPGAGKLLRRLLRAPEADAFFLRLHDAAQLDAAPRDVTSGRARQGDPVLLLRLFRRLASVRYRGLVHESVDGALRERRARFTATEVDLVHLGNVPELRKERAKTTRNVELLRRQCATDPENSTSFGYLAMELRAAGDAAGALEAAERGWGIAANQPPWRSLQRIAVARALVALDGGEPARAAEVTDRLEALRGRLGSDALLVRGMACFRLAAQAGGAARRDHALRAAGALREALSRAGEPDPHRIMIGSAGGAAAFHLGLSLLLAGDPAAALPAFEDAARTAPTDLDVRLGLAECRLTLGEPSIALKLCESLLDERPDGWLLAACSAAALGARDDARMLLENAHRRAAHGFGSPHRREAAQALADTLACPLTP